MHSLSRCSAPGSSWKETKVHRMGLRNCNLLSNYCRCPVSFRFMLKFTNLLLRAEGLDWHVALDFNAEISGGPEAVELVEGDDPQSMIGRRRREVAVHSGNMDLTDVSTNGRIWTFTPNHDSLDTSNWDSNKKIFLIAYFDNMNSSDIAKEPV